MCGHGVRGILKNFIPIILFILIYLYTYCPTVVRVILASVYFRNPMQCVVFFYVIQISFESSSSQSDGSPYCSV